jgi:UDP:flavonoid glycosyltransferase YjiC (YdhE family)
MANVAPWHAVIEAAGSLDADVVATIGSRVDPSTLGVVPGNVRVESYVPQTHLLERARIVVSHSGSGTLFAAAARGIPQLCVPIGADQWENADALASVGAGIVLEDDEREADRVHQALHSLLDGQTHQKAARVLAEQFAALPHPRELVSVIETLP